MFTSFGLRGSRPLSIAAALLPTLLAAAPVFAQPGPLRAPTSAPTGGVKAAFGRVPYQAVRQPVRQPEFAAMPPVVAGTEGDYWIVSSRVCPQAGEGPLVRCDFGFFQCSGGEPLRSDRQAFQNWLQPGVPVCIVVHGSFTDFETVCHDAENTFRWLRRAAPDRPLQLVYFTWPSEGALTWFPVVDLGLLGRRSEFNGIYLSQFISELPPQSPVSLIGHSHGARASISALHLLGGGEVQGYRFAGESGRPIRAVLAAAALDYHWIVSGHRYGQALLRAEGVLNLRNQADFALLLYPFRRPFSQSALGRIGLPPRDRPLLGPYADRFTELDVTPLLREAHNWPEYHRWPQIAQAMVPWVYFTDRSSPASLSAETLILDEGPHLPDLPPLRESMLGPMWEATPTFQWATSPVRG